MTDGVTVVIPSKDRVRIVVDTVRLALLQRGVDLEVIVVDDGSNDGTSEALAALDDPRLTILRNEPNRGVANARNRGIAEATHPWIAFLDDDDRWSPEKLRIQLERARAEQADFVYTAGLAVSAMDGRVLYASPAVSPAYVHAHIRSRNLMFAGSSNVVARTTLLRQLGGFDEALHHIADWDLWIRLTEAGRPAACREPLVAYVVHETNMHREAIDSAMREGRLLRVKHANSSLPGHFDDVVFRGWIADGQEQSGRAGRAALTYAGTAVRHRSRADARRALGAALRAVKLRRRFEPTAYDGPTPDWLSLGP
jgi:glycosyltransferase involved in cell wall biosynthesis